ncbi:hypothetical protein EDC56_2135 [Sinobacterium caligoides]|uniref:Pyridoxamine 5'-phosphate oxidase N-terminal domain-containing protein n=1 Tax=Sinobacterium caligoides TaxID=933926 RepID=A0A3N2DPI2_9GAMM|nr:pyridoxamine 5'-phosphate oxidase family protein [Sinobacterium caligoides]ROS01690.1 hypothetical protein EDC56_2135 [Sinobacterium caligoides]
MAYEKITSLAQLRELYGEPREVSLQKQQDQLDDYSKQFLSLSTFALLSTANSEGVQDCSPRGDVGGFIHCLDDKTIALPDRPGNNRLDSLSNIVQNPNVGLLVLVPGFKECLRINGRASLVTDQALLADFEQRNKLPKSVIVVRVEEVYFHCTKAITRANLWDVEAQLDRALMPSFTRILMGQIDPQKPEQELRDLEQAVAVAEKERSLY